MSFPFVHYSQSEIVFLCEPFCALMGKFSVAQFFLVMLVQYVKKAVSHGKCVFFFHLFRGNSHIFPTKKQPGKGCLIQSMQFPTLPLKYAQTHRLLKCRLRIKVQGTKAKPPTTYK